MDTPLSYRQIVLAFYTQAVNDSSDSPCDSYTWKNSVNAIAKQLRMYNPNFDNAQFLNDCGWRLVFGVNAQ